MEKTKASRSLLMPSVWDCTDFPEGAYVKICTFHWTDVVLPDGDPLQPLLHRHVASGHGSEFQLVQVRAAGGKSFVDWASRTVWETVTGVTESGKPKQYFVSFRASNGCLLAANKDATVTARVELPGGGVPLECVFRLDPLPDKKKVTIWSVSNEHYLRAWNDGTLRLHMEQATSWEHFSIRQLAMVPKFIGVNLGGWLVVEKWMCPTELFEGVHQDLDDGTKVSMKSFSEGRWVCAEGGGGEQLTADRPSPSNWETFYLRRDASGGLMIRAGSGHYWTVDSETGEIRANRVEGGFRETFGIRREIGGSTKFQLRASTGKWVRVVSGGRLVADVDEDAPGWSTSSTLELQIQGRLGGEYQLGASLEKSVALTRLTTHRRGWIKEEDFRKISSQGVNAVRIPVGYWIADDPRPEYPFVEGSLACLDQAFEWAGRQKLRVVLCLHAAPGSQNGWEHSGSRDGIASWGREGSGNIERTVAVIQFLAARYGSHPCFVGLEPINEPTSSGVSFQDLSNYYLSCYKILRHYSPQAYFIIDSRIFASEREWDSFMTGPEYTNVIFDAHCYQVHDTNTFGGKSVQFNLDYPKEQCRAALKKLERGTRLVCVGEWSLALNCSTSDEIFKKFGEAQVECFLESSAGFFFWSLKHGQGWRSWSFQTCVENGWLSPTLWKTE